MATLLMHRAPRAFALGLGATSAFAASTLMYRAQHRPLLCEPMSSQASGIFNTYSSDAKVPVVKNGSVNRATFRQVSSGSILGLIGGVAVGMFSKTLTFLIGISIAGVQYLESRGISIVPKSRIQGWFKNIDVKSAIQDNVAFKICFGTTFALAAFAEF